MELNFLDKIEMEELEGKEEIIKSIRFSKEEFYMLKYCKHLNKRFATYVKELIDQEINDTRIKEINEIDIEKLKEELKVELREEIKSELLAEIKEELSKYKFEKKSDDDEENDVSEDKKALLDFMTGNQ